MRMMMKNILTVDVEEWFHPEALQHQFLPETWDAQPSRIVPLMERLLDLFDEQNARATFFVLGWVAEHHPKLVRQLVERGHEVATHSYGHRMATKLEPKTFKDDLLRSVKILQDITGQDILGFRAPTFSVTRQTFWVFDVLAEAGLKYDSSIYPIWHDRYGVPEAPRTVFEVETRSGAKIVEFPMPTLRIFGKNFPFGGGGYLRLFPLRFTTRAIRRFNKNGFPAIIYMHPWEFDAQQPKVPLGRLQSLRHYGNIKRNLSKVGYLLKTFEWTNFKTYLSQIKNKPDFEIKKLNIDAI